MDKFLETYNLPTLNQEEKDILNRLITSSATELVIKKLRANKSPRLMASQGKSNKQIKKN